MSKERLEELRIELREQRISYGELAELQSLTEYIEPGDTELLEAAGVPEFSDDNDGVLTIGDMSDDGLLQIIDTNWNGDGVLNVTVREMIGGGDTSWVGGMPKERMRRLARRALQHPETIRSARTINKFMAGECGAYTFAVSRLQS